MDTENQSLPELSDDDITRIEQLASKSFQRHRCGTRGQQITPADSHIWHVIQATRAVLIKALKPEGE